MHILFSKCICICTNGILGHGQAGVAVESGASPQIHGNWIHSGRTSGVVYFEGGMGTLASNTVRAVAGMRRGPPLHFTSPSPHPSSSPLTLTPTPHTPTPEEPGLWVAYLGYSSLCRCGATRRRGCRSQRAPSPSSPPTGSCGRAAARPCRSHSARCRSARERSGSSAGSSGNEI